MKGPVPDYIEAYRTAQAHGNIVIGFIQPLQKLFDPDMEIGTHQDFTVRFSFQEIAILGPAGYQIVMDKLIECHNRKL